MRKLLPAFIFSSSLLYVSLDAHAELQNFSRANCALTVYEAGSCIGGGNCRNESISWDPTGTKWALSVKSVEYKYGLGTLTRLGGNSSSFDKAYCGSTASSTNKNASTSDSAGSVLLTCRNAATGTSDSKPSTTAQTSARKTWGSKPVFRVDGKHVHQNSSLKKQHSIHLRPLVI